jgi:hypothetical protein
MLAETWAWGMRPPLLSWITPEIEKAGLANIATSPKRKIRGIRTKWKQFFKTFDPPIH